MITLAAFVLLGSVGAQESVDLKFNPPLDRVTEFVTVIDAELEEGTPVFDAKIVIAQRAKREGPNFRFNRYVSSSVVTTGLPNTELDGYIKTLSELSGKSFPLLVSPEGKELPLKRGKYDNDADDVPNFLVPAFGRIAIGEARSVTDFSLGPKGQATLREVRDLGTDRAAVFGYVAQAGSDAGNGTLVLSTTDGIPLFFDIRATFKTPVRDIPIGIHLRMKRQNVVGLDRLIADLRLDG